MKLLRPSARPPTGNPRDTAVYWIAREDEGRLSPDDQVALQEWLDADPAHAEVYARAREAIGAPGLYSAHPQMMEIREAALASLSERRPRAWMAAAAAALGAVVLGAAWMAFWPDTGPNVSRLEAAAMSAAPGLHPNSAIYRTAVGERTSVTLPDGSVATLNTDTLLKIAYTGRERGVRLVRGQALFEVASNKKVPFQVYAGDRRITAVGTVFDVRLDRKTVKVALVEGVVRVARIPPARPQSSAPPVQQVVMTAGELLEATPASTMTVRPADTASATTWKQGVVVFKAASLAEAVAEVNRYTTHPLTIADPSIAGYRVTGVFRTGDPDTFASSVAEVLPVEVETLADGSLTLRAGEKY